MIQTKSRRCRNGTRNRIPSFFSMSLHPFSSGVSFASAIFKRQRPRSIRWAVHIICLLLVLPASAFTSAEDFLRSYDTDFAAKDIVTGRARIERLDHENGLVTLVHEAVVSSDGSLSMPDMPMTLPVSRPVWLHKFKPGEHVLFKAARRHGAITLISIKPAEGPHSEKRDDK